MFDYKPKSETEKIQDEIKELASFIKRCDAGLILASEEDTAMAVKIALGGDNFFELWIGKNDHIINVILLEKAIAQSSIEELRNKLKQPNA